MPKVSVIIPNYNHERYLAQRVESVLRQTYLDFDVLLMDDKSTDGSVSVLKQFAGHPRVRLELNDVNSGSTFHQWNKGVRSVSGRYVWIAESDDFAEPTFLAELMQLIDANKGCALACCRSWIVDAEGHRLHFADERFIRRSPRWSSDFVLGGGQYTNESMITENTIPNASAVLFDREAYTRAGGADGSFRCAGDWDLWSKILAQGDIAYTAKPLNYYRTHGGNVRSATLKRAGLELIERLRVLEGSIARAPVTPDEVELAFQGLTRHWMRSISRGALSWSEHAEAMRRARRLGMRPKRRLVAFAARKGLQLVVGRPVSSKSSPMR